MEGEMEGGGGGGCSEGKDKEARMVKVGNGDQRGSICHIVLCRSMITPSVTVIRMTIWMSLSLSSTL